MNRQGKGPNPKVNNTKPNPTLLIRISKGPRTCELYTLALNYLYKGTATTKVDSEGAEREPIKTKLKTPKGPTYLYRSM